MSETLAKYNGKRLTQIPRARRVEPPIPPGILALRPALKRASRSEVVDESRLPQIERRKNLYRWIEKKKAEAKERGDPFFLGVPEAWLGDPHFACVNGHISTRLLKVETFDFCLACRGIIRRVPPCTTEAQLANILEGK